MAKKKTNETVAVEAAQELTATETAACARLNHTNIVAVAFCDHIGVAPQ